MDIPWWGWILIIAGGIVLGVVSVPFWFKLLIAVAEWGRHVGYAREARRRNKRARLLRLERDEWEGYPLPTGKEGELRITEEMQILNPNRVRPSMLERQLRDRARDLKVDIWIEKDPMSRDIFIVWKKHKGRWPREVY